ncbi:MAG: hypothetical protein JJE53_01225 [Candidatus Pacebacteria bacterium]|nr:hypothetical protein [Candidatus Paceibacterota bacterium]
MENNKNILPKVDGNGQTELNFDGPSTEEVLNDLDIRFPNAKISHSIVKPDGSGGFIYGNIGEEKNMTIKELTDYYKSVHNVYETESGNEKYWNK